MLKKLLTKEERIEFSAKNLSKIKKIDYYVYIQLKQEMLDSLVKNYQNSDLPNPALEKIIKKQKELIDALNLKYYKDIIPSKKTGDFYDDSKKFKKEIKKLKKIQK